MKNMTRDTNLTNLTNNIQIVIHLIMKSINLKEKYDKGHKSDKLNYQYSDCYPSCD